MSYDPSTDPIYQNIADAPHSATAPAKHPDRLTDMRVAHYFVEKYRNHVCHWPEVGSSLVFDGRRWNTNTPGGAYPFLKAMIHDLYAAAFKIADDGQRADRIKALTLLENHGRQTSVLSAAAVVPDFVVTADRLDSDPWLMNVQNGTVNLRTGVLQAHRHDDYLTRIAGTEYHHNANCPTFITTLNAIFRQDAELIAYVQRLFGYMLTGTTGEQVLAFFHGSGSNGKTTIVNVLENILGDYAGTAPGDLVVQRNGSDLNNLATLAKLRGSRLCKISELNDGDRLSEAMVKTLTGQDRVTCRFLHQGFFDYYPQFKILMLSNHKPSIRGTDHGIWRRIHLIPFLRKFSDSEKDTTLPEKLRAEYPAILHWMVQGCLEWQRIGLQPPKVVLQAVKDYQKTEDVFQQWLEERCETGPEFSETAQILLNSFIEYTRWKNVTPQKFGKMLSEAEFERSHSRAGARYLGLRLSVDCDGCDDSGPFSGFSSSNFSSREKGKKDSESSHSSHMPENDDCEVSEEVFTQWL